MLDTHLFYERNEKRTVATIFRVILCFPMQIQSHKGKQPTQNLHSNFVSCIAEHTQQKLIIIFYVIYQRSNCGGKKMSNQNRSSRLFMFQWLFLPFVRGEKEKIVKLIESFLCRYLLWIVSRFVRLSLCLIAFLLLDSTWMPHNVDGAILLYGSHNCHKHSFSTSLLVWFFSGSLHFLFASRFLCLVR